MIYCATCKADVNPVASIGSNMVAEQVCPGCAGVLGAPVTSVNAAAPASQPRASRPSATTPTTAELPRLVRDRKRFLKAEIRRMKRELDQLEKLGRSPRKRASVTPLHRTGT